MAWHTAHDLSMQACLRACEKSGVAIYQACGWELLVPWVLWGLVRELLCRAFDEGRVLNCGIDGTVCALPRASSDVMLCDRCDVRTRWLYIGLQMPGDEGIVRYYRYTVLFIFGGRPTVLAEV